MKRPNVGARLRAPDPVTLAARHGVATIPSRGQAATQIAQQPPWALIFSACMAPAPAHTRPDTQMRAPVMARVGTLFFEHHQPSTQLQEDSP